MSYIAEPKIFKPIEWAINLAEKKIGRKMMPVRLLLWTPIQQNPKVIAKMTEVFSEKEFATIVTTIAQVDYWTRIIQGFGIQPAGFLENCDVNLF